MQSNRVEQKRNRHRISAAGVVLMVAWVGAAPAAAQSDGNVFGGVGNTSIGSFNNIFAGEDNLLVDSNGNVVSGVGNEVTGASHANSVIGIENVVFGNSRANAVFGELTYVDASNRNLVGGGFHDLVGHGNLLAGTDHDVEGDYNVVGGWNNAVAADRTIVLGSESSATAPDAVVLGRASEGSVADTISVGAAGNERRIRNVADPVADFDAANYRQIIALEALIADLTERVATLEAEIDSLPPGWGKGKKPGRK